MCITLDVTRRLTMRLAKRLTMRLTASAGPFVLAGLCLLNAPGLCLARTRAEQPPPAFEGTSLPEPPRQREPWTPPRTTLPEAFVTAARALFEQGMADPRGGEYREVEVVAGSVWGDTTKMKTHAWVLPAPAGGTRRFAVGWSGLVTPLVSAGGPADLRHDIDELIKADEEMRARWAEERGSFPFTRFHHARAEPHSASHESLLPLKACLLLRLGEARLAERVWAAYTVGMDAEVNDNALRLADPYVMLATDWAYALFDRAVCAHMRGDDRLALLAARALADMRGRLSAELEMRSALWPQGYRAAGYQRYYLSFLAPLDSLLADQERRAQEGRKGAGAAPKRSGDLESLVAELDEVAARQSGQPGGVDVGEDPRVRALIARGGEAVEPLLRTLETDARLTRSVSFSRAFHADRHLITVGQTAYTALTRILKTDAFGAPGGGANVATQEGRRQLAARIRAYLEKYDRGAEEERWYALLKDDAAGAEAWAQAAANIISSTDYKGTPPAWVFNYAPAPAARAAKGVRLRGEPLRGRNSPSVSQLLARRMLELAERRGEGPPYRSLYAATNFALALLVWEGRAQLPAVNSFQNLLKSLYAAANVREGDARAHLRGMLVSLYLKRFEVEDEDAFGEYAEWVGALTPAEAGEHVAHLFTPMWRRASHPAVAAAAARMFGGAGSPWLPLIDAGDRQSFHRAELLATPMLDVQSFRERVLEGLADKTVVGTLRPRRTSGGDKYELNVENAYTAVLAGSSNSSAATFQVPAEDPRAARAPEPLSVRACDVYASRLVRLGGAPPFQVYWTEPERDRAVAEMAAFIRNHGGRFAAWLGME